jgi:LuxR family maltose regulon positive regulatory protein
MRAVALYEAGGEAAGLVQAHTLIALVHGAGGDDDAREEGLQQALALAQQWQLPAALAKVTAWQARCALWAQNGLAARALALQAEQELQVAGGNEAPFGAARELVALTLVRVYLAADTLETLGTTSAEAAADVAQARYIIARWQAFGRRTGLMALVAETLLLQARAEQMQGQAEAARRSLLQALLLAQPGSVVRLFVDEGVWLAPLLRDVTADERVGAYAQRLLETVEAAWPLTPTGDEVQPLTARQKEVLEMLARGLSNREIAERLVISLETVRWHTKQIYRRLDVRNRTEAAAYARRAL